MIAVYSHWSLDRNSNGYNSFQDFLMTMSLSVLVTANNFKQINFVTNDLGKNIFINQVKLPFTKVSTSQNQFNSKLPQWLWGYAKLFAYTEQTEPFVHIDNDVFLWDGLPDEVSSKKMFFQSLETPFEAGYGWYVPLLHIMSKCPNVPVVIKNHPVDYSYNCGIMGCNDPSLIKEWFIASTAYVRDPENLKVMSSNLFKDKLIYQNLLHEQYFITSILDSKGLKPYEDVGLMLKTESLTEDCYLKGRRYTHLWGLDKKNKESMAKVYARMKDDFPEYYNRILNLCKLY